MKIDCKLFGKPLENRSGFISVLALGIIVNAAIFAVGLVKDVPSDLRQNQMAGDTQYEQVVQNMQHDMRMAMRQQGGGSQSYDWMSEKMDEGVPIRFSGKEKFVPFPKRDMYGNIVDEPAAAMYTRQ